MKKGLPECEKRKGHSAEETELPANRFPYIAPLTPFRFLAALGVLLQHLSARYDEFGIVMAPVRPFLGSGVSFFFVLSGFVLAWKFKLEKPRFASYYLSRIIKIYPMAWLGLAVLIAGAIIGGTNYFSVPARDISDPAILLKFFSHIFLLQAWWPNTSHVLGFNGPAWFLSVLIFLYAILPLIMVGTRKLICIVLPICLMIVVICIIIQPHLLYLTDRAKPFVHFFPPVRMLEFALGVTAAHLATPLSKGLPQYIKRTNPTVLNTVCLLIAMLPITRFGFVKSMGLPPLVRYYLFTCGNGVVYAILIAVIAAHQLAAEKTSRLYGSTPLQLLGNSSFALFVLHVPIIVVLRPSTWWEAMFMVMPIAVICHLTYEKYTNRTLTHVINKLGK